MCFTWNKNLIEFNKYYKIGARVEGILRQAADVDDVERRVREYEQGLCFCSLIFWLDFASIFDYIAC
jgi:hypothetical protein